jgi:hypothetical protein
MPLECCQMLSIVASSWYHGYGTLPKADGTPYSTAKGAFRNHPCTKWAAASIHNAYWLIKHGMNLCDEYHLRYDKQHSCYNTLLHAYYLFPKGKITEVTSFVRAMPDEFKLDTTIDTLLLLTRCTLAANLGLHLIIFVCQLEKPEWVN